MSYFGHILKGDKYEAMRLVVQYKERWKEKENREDDARLG